MESCARHASLFIDGGGSTTRVGIGSRLRVEVQHEGASCNPVSVGADRARANLHAVVRSAWLHRPPDVAAIDSIWCCLSTASSTQDLPRVASEVFAALPQELKGIDELWIANDIAPLLVHDGRVSPRVVAICGTGTGFCALNLPAERCARASGCEYLLSDEGGGFDIGLLGLRAVVRALDGRGPKTTLSELLLSWRNVHPDALPALVYSSDEPKVLVASFARFVLQAAELGDEPSRGIIERAANELAIGIVAVAEGAGLEGHYEISLAGSNLISPDHAILRNRLHRILADRARGAAIVSIVGSPLEVVARFSGVVGQEAKLATLLARSVPFGHFHASEFA